MKNLDEMPQICKYFNGNGLVKQEVYRSNKYSLIYVNEKLYEYIFKEKFNFSQAKKKIEELFSVTLQKNNNFITNGFCDKQFDPMNISLCGNLGSGRSFFYLKNFNIKGEKTVLATSKRLNYGDGKYPLFSAIKEAVFANILADDFNLSNFKTLAVLNKNEEYVYKQEYLDSNDKIRIKEIPVSTGIEIRYYNSKQLFRLSNYLLEEKNISQNLILNLAKILASVEAEKFCKRLLHGSWSVGNVSIDGNLIDFDTACFVKGRFPQYSNTNKYKASFFGFELDGQKIMIEEIFNHYKFDQDKKIEILKIMDQEYQSKLKQEFCELIGLSYENHYLKFKEKIDKLFDKFYELSRKFLPNYYDTDVVEPYVNKTFLFDFSNFFCKFLLKNNSTIQGLNLLMNDLNKVEYKKIGFIKRNIIQFFKDYLVDESKLDSYSLDAIEFIEQYKDLFNDISKQENLKEIIIKQFVVNFDRSYLTGNNNFIFELCSLLSQNKISVSTFNLILNNLIDANKRKYSDQNYINLKIYTKFLTYFKIEKNNIFFVLKAYNDKNIDFANVKIGEEYFSLSYKNNIWQTKNISFNKMQFLFDEEVFINGKKFNKYLLNY